MKLFLLLLTVSTINYVSSAPASPEVVSSSVVVPTRKAAVSSKSEPTPTSTAVPVHNHKDDPKEPPCSKPTAPVPSSVDEYYDQRQNGTHNIRVEIDNIVILHAPLDMGGGGSNDDAEVAALLQQLIMVEEMAQKPTPPKPTTDAEEPEKGEISTTTAAVNTQKRQRAKVRLASLLGPLLRHHH